MTQVPACALLASGVEPRPQAWLYYGLGSLVATAALFVMAFGCWTRMERIVGLVSRFAEHVPSEPCEEHCGGAVATVEASLARLDEAVRTLERDATRDPLTGTFNRRCCATRLESDLARSHREGTPFSIALFDLDGLKEINDQGGHAMGDAALRGLADVLRACVREGDWVARWGGDEFLVGLWNADEEAIQRAVRRVAARLAELPFDLGGHRVALTACAGVAQAEKGDDAERLFGRADAALFGLKGTGRGHVERS